MTQVSELRANYGAIRARLRRPPQRVPDDGSGEHPRKVTIVTQLVPKEVVPNTSDSDDGSAAGNDKTQPPSPDPVVGVSYIILKPVPRQVRLSLALFIVAKAYGLSVDDLTGRSRKAHHTIPRHVAFYLGHKICGTSKNRIGKFMGYDHTSVIHGIRRIERLIGDRSDFSEQITLLEAAILAEHQYRLTLPTFSQSSLADQPRPDPSL